MIVNKSVGSAKIETLSVHKLLEASDNCANAPFETAERREIHNKCTTTQFLNIKNKSKGGEKSLKKLPSSISSLLYQPQQRLTTRQKIHAMAILTQILSSTRSSASTLSK